MSRPQLSPLETAALRAFAQQVRARFGERIRRLVLFGSRARGSGRDDSDLDILLLLDGMSRADRRAIVDLGADIGIEHHLVLSPLVADANSWRHDLPLSLEIEKDGVPL